MTPADIPLVSALERDAFVGEGVMTPFARELANKLATYLVACSDNDVLGYAGLWFIVDEAHLTSIAVREEQRRRGIGERLLKACLELALERQATMMTLEVRASNRAAQALYEKYGFKTVGVRRGYYSDNHEDAYLMTVSFESLVPSFESGEQRETRN
jgi:ribosomal-protein-alanine N-acetyltransferase